MRRREFIALLGGAAAAFPLAARAQQQPMPVIGFLNSAAPEGYTPMVAAFRQGLKETGYIEDHNVSIEYRWAEGQFDRLPALAADLVRREVTAIAATGGLPPALAAKAATATIPIVFTVADDPVEVGLVASLNRPESNLTGVTTLNVEVGSKRLELLHELIPTATIMALLVNPTTPTAKAVSIDAQTTAGTLGLQLHVLHASVEREIDDAFAALAPLRAGAVAVANDPLFLARRNQLVALAARNAIPAAYAYREAVLAGGLMSYGGSIADAYRLVGVYTGRILKGEKPANLPVQRATKVQLIVNLKTAKALGLTFPLSLLGRADEVIE
jgi:putative ABC transport system substrate-binding protein